MGNLSTKDDLQSLFERMQINDLNDNDVEIELNKLYNTLNDSKSNEFKNSTIDSALNSNLFHDAFYKYLHQTTISDLIAQSGRRNDENNEKNQDFSQISNVNCVDTKFLNVLQLLVKIISKILNETPKNLEAFEDLIERLDLIISSIGKNSELYQDFNKNVLLLRERIVEGRKLSGMRRDAQDNREPPEDFRLMPVVPTLEEIKSSRNLFLRRNVTSGEFKNVEHYLDIQYRLLREDYVGSLREGVMEYLAIQRMKKSNVEKTPNNSKLSNIRVYEGVEIIDSVFDLRGMVHQIKINITERLANVRWETSKRLLQGSLVCLSDNNYRTAFFATVFDRDSRALAEHGYLLLSFDDWMGLNSHLCQLRYKKQRPVFTMIESTAYFESYRHTLESLKVFNERNMPFKNHLVYSENLVIACPSYLKPFNHITNPVCYDFRPLIKDMFKINTKICYPMPLDDDTPSEPVSVFESYDFLSNEFSKIPVIDNKFWPTASLLGLNPSQYEALKLALRKELVVIQGPPGTGKTFIGVQVIKMLLHNYSILNAIDNSKRGFSKFQDNSPPGPIVIVCYTNHALDQLLMLISKYLDISNEELIRLGGRCQEPNLQYLTLANIKSNYIESRAFTKDIYKLVKEAKTRLWSAKRKLEKIFEELNAVTKRESIISFQNIERRLINMNFSSLFDNQIEQFYRKFTFLSDLNKDCIFRDWLGIGCFPENFSRDEMNEIFYMESQLDNNYSSDFISIDELDFEDNCKYDNQTDSDYHESLSEDEFIESDESSIEKKNCSNLDTLDPDKMLEEAELINKARETDEDVVYRGKIKQLFGKQRDSKRRNDRNNESLMDKYNSLNIFMCQISDKEKARRTRKIFSNVRNVMSEREVWNITDLWSLNIIDRYRFYRYLHNCYINQLTEQIKLTTETYKIALSDFEAAKDEESLYILRNAKVVGMTTTGAAKHQSLLKKLKPSVIVAEEAAEVFESHIITCLNDACKHLILIGDNEQLRPSPNLYKLEKHYGLDISLFERLVNNKIPKVRLNVQHRMRPEISFLMRHFYEDLIDAENVKIYENIVGVKDNVYFVNHEHLETGDFDSMSKSNVFEAEYIVRLCDYFLKQNYEPTRITILVAYGGQLLKVKRKISQVLNEEEGQISEKLRHVRVTPVDNYQGEENDIILLSLVRSNTFGKIGFISISNRICVALSRAKKGFYVLGNFNHLSKYSNLWTNIVKDLTDRNIIGTSLKLCCQNHPNIITEIKELDDFKQCPDGGCMELCDQDLNCGHKCTKRCHVTSHDEIQCLKPCERLFKDCSQDHKCNGICYEECNKCTEVVVKTVPKCNHEIETLCSNDPNEIDCDKLINKQLACGHMKEIKCYLLLKYDVEVFTHEAFKCETLVDKAFQDCGHVIQVKCKDQLDAKCTKIVKKKVPKCGHIINARCSDDEESLMCLSKVSVSLNQCGHPVEIFCYKNTKNYVDDLQCDKKVFCRLNCGHQVEVPCHKSGSTHECPISCSSTLDCGHVCSRKCADHNGHNNNNHPYCNSKCKNVLICGHACNKTCGVPCVSCDLQCNFRCPHNSCTHECYKACKPCTKPCIWSCEHHKCEKRCGEICDVKNCNQPCKRKLKCGHVCQSVCNELCVCQCNTADESLDPSKSYIRLSDCQCVIELNEFNNHMRNETYRLNYQIGFPACPKCSKPIYYSKLHANLIRRQFESFNNYKNMQTFNRKSSFIYFKILKSIETISGDNKQLIEKLQVNEQIQFLINRYNCWKLFDDTFKKYSRVTNNRNISTRSFDIENLLRDTPIEISNKQAFELTAKTVVFHYYVAACANLGPNHKFTKKLEFDVDNSLNGVEFPKKYFKDLFNSLIRTKLIDKLPSYVDVYCLYKQVNSIYTQ